MIAHRNPDFEAFVLSARTKPEIWRIAVGFGLILVVYFVIMLLILIVFGGLLSALVYSFPSQNARGFEFVEPLDMLVLLSTFSGATIGALLAVRFLHGRGFLTLLFVDARQFRRHAVVAFHIIVPIFTAFILVSVAIAPPIAKTPFVQWLSLMPFALVLLLIQTSAEEIVFRGYLLQQLAARFQSRWVFMVSPSVLFGLLHYDPSELGPNAWLVVLDTTIIGFIAADLTVRTGNLAAAIVFHFVNNVFALLLVSIDGSMSGLALYVAPYSAADVETLRTLLFADIAIYLIGYLIYGKIMNRTTNR